MAAPTRTRRRFFTPPVITLIALSFLLGLSEFIVVGILPDIAGGIHVPERHLGGVAEDVAGDFVREVDLEPDEFAGGEVAVAHEVL